MTLSLLNESKVVVIDFLDSSQGSGLYFESKGGCRILLMKGIIGSYPDEDGNLNFFCLAWCLRFCGMVEMKLWSWNDGHVEAMNTHAFPWGMKKFVQAQQWQQVLVGFISIKRSHMVSFANTHGYSANPHVKKYHRSEKMLANDWQLCHSSFTYIHKIILLFYSLVACYINFQYFFRGLADCTNQKH